MASPFTFTPGMAGQAYIDMHYAAEIVDNFTDENSEKYVYKILGLRGSGKSVVYSKVLTAFKEKSDWFVYTLSTSGNPIQTLIGCLSKEPFISEYNKRIHVEAGGNAEGNIKIVSVNGTASAGMDFIPNEKLYSGEATLKQMVGIASKKGYKILIGVDDIAKTSQMIEFLSIFGDMVLNRDNNIYLMCTGLEKNIEDFANVPHLSFFVRGDRIDINTLSIPQITNKYEKLLSIENNKAKELAEYTYGYAYAYQVLGELCYMKKTDKIDAVEAEFDARMADQYEIIWHDLPDGEKELLRIIANSKTGETKDIKDKMNSPLGFNSLRSRLVKKHLINTKEHGKITIDLPRIKEYINTWQ